MLHAAAGLPAFKLTCYRAFRHADTIDDFACMDWIHVGSSHEKACMACTGDLRPFHYHTDKPVDIHKRSAQYIHDKEVSIKDCAILTLQLYWCPISHESPAHAEQGRYYIIWSQFDVKAWHIMNLHLARCLRLWNVQAIARSYSVIYRGIHQRHDWWTY